MGKKELQPGSDGHSEYGLWDTQTPKNTFTTLILHHIKALDMSLYFPFPVFSVLYKHSFTQNTTIRLFLASNSCKSLQVREIYSLIPEDTFHLICSHYCDLQNKTKQNLYIFFSYFYFMASLICSLIN